MDIPFIINDAVSKLETIEKITNVNLSLLLDKRMSILYEIFGIKNKKKVIFILKICKLKNEARKSAIFFRYLLQKEVSSIKPLIISKEYNYYVAQKENLASLIDIILSTENKLELIDYFRKIGETFAKIKINKERIFNERRYLDYTLAKIDELEGLSGHRYRALKEKIYKIIKEVHNESSEDSLACDFSFSNLHFNKNNELVLVDMGFAHVDNVYYNIAQIYFQLKFNVLSRFYERKKLTNALFNSFLRGSNNKKLDSAQFELYLIQQVILSNIGLFYELEEQKNIFKKLKLTYDLYRQKAYLSHLIKKVNNKNSGHIACYDYAAETYDADRYLKDCDLFIDNLRKEKLNLLLEPQREIRLLDIGTGTGKGILFFANKVSNIVGLDASFLMLRKGKEKIEQNNIQNVRLVQGDAANISFKEDSFDAVLALRFLHIFTPCKKQSIFIEEMERVSKKGGILLVEVTNIFSGAVLGLARKYVFHDRRGYNWPWDIYRWSRGLKVERVVGVAPPGIKFLFKINPGLAKKYSGLANLFPINFLSFGLVVKLRKT